MSNETTTLKITLEADSKMLEQALSKANISLENFKEKTEKTNGKSNNKGLKGLLGTVKNLAPAIGVAFTVDAVNRFGREVIKLGTQIEGIERQFRMIESTGKTSLEELKMATKNTTSEFKLMSMAVQADNFKIPIENLGSFFEFATARAAQTGESVDYLVNSIVLGIGRKSPLILDNLGITLVRLKEAMGKVGRESASVADISEAVSRIAKEETEMFDLLGKTAKTSAQELAGLTAAWTDWKTEFGKSISGQATGGSNWLSDALNDAKAAMQMADKMGKGGGWAVGTVAFFESLVGIEGKGDEAIEFLKKYNTEQQTFARQMDSLLPSLEGMREALSEKNWVGAAKIINKLKEDGQLSEEYYNGLGDALYRVKDRVKGLEKIESDRIKKEEEAQDNRTKAIDKYMRQLEAIEIQYEQGFIDGIQRAEAENSILQKALVEFTQDVDNLGLAATKTYGIFNDMLVENNGLLESNAKAITKAQEAFDANQLLKKYMYNSDAAGLADPSYMSAEHDEEWVDEDPYAEAADKRIDKMEDEAAHLRDLSQMWSALSTAMGQVSGLFDNNNGISSAISKITKLGQVISAAAAAQAAFASIADPSAAARAIGAAATVATSLAGLLGSFGGGGGGVASGNLNGGGSMNYGSGQRLYTEISGRNLRIVLDREGSFSNKRG